MKKSNSRKFLALLLAMFSLTLGSCAKPNLYTSDEQYQIYLKAQATGFEGTYSEWLESIKGKDGADGKDGAKGDKGDPGPKGDTGDPGEKGDKGDKGDDGTNGKDSPYASLKFSVVFELQGGIMPEGFASEIEVSWGATIALPVPTRANYNFLGWFSGHSVNDGQFFVHSAVFTNLTLYARWKLIDEQQSPFKLHIVGDMQNSDLSYISWDTVTVYDERSILHESNDIYTTTLVLGYGANFKIKEPGMAWNDEENGGNAVELTYYHLNKKSSVQYIAKDEEHWNFNITHAGTYTISVDFTQPNDEFVFITYMGEPTGSGYTPNPIISHTVTFYLDTLGTLYGEPQTVINGEQVVLPEDPTMDGKIFVDWYVDQQLELVFNRAQSIVSDLSLYAKWVTDGGGSTDPEIPEKLFHVIGSFGEEDGMNWWDLSASNSYFHLKYNKVLDVYTIKLSIGHNTKFSVKEKSATWEDDVLIYNFNNIPQPNKYPYLSNDLGNNIVAKLAGSYEITLNLNNESVNVVWLNNDFGDQTIEQTIITSDWGISGSHNDWGENGKDIELIYDKASQASVGRAVYLEKNGSWKLRRNNDWQDNFGHKSFNVYVDDVMEGVIEDGNIFVKESGYYTIVYTEDEYGNGMLSVQQLSFALRGSALSETMWDSDSAMLSDVTYNSDTGFYTYKGTYELQVGELRAKLATSNFINYEGLEFLPKHSNDTPNLIVNTAGNYEVTLNIKLYPNGSINMFNYYVTVL